MKILAITLSILFVFSVVTVPTILADEMEAMPSSKAGYVVIKIDRATGELAKDGIQFFNSKGEREKPEIDRPVGFPLEVQTEVKKIDSIIWYWHNPTCVWHNSREVCR